MRFCLLTAALTVLGLLAERQAAQAQYYGVSGASSGSSYNRSGSTLGRPGLFGNRSLGSGLSPGTRSFGGGMQSDVMDISNARFLRQNRQPGQFVGFNPETISRFVGSNLSAATPSGGYQSSGLYTQGSWSGSQDARPQFGRDSWSSQPGAVQQSIPVRTEFHVAFDHPSISLQRISAALAKRLSQTPAIQAQSPIQVEMHRRTVILRGTVATNYDRSLAEQLVRLEPGIEGVRNELVVAAATVPETTEP